MSWHVSDSSIGKGMRNIIFHETKRERKFYEDKKQKALRYLDHTIIYYNDIKNYDTEQKIKDHFAIKLQRLKKLVNDI